MSHNVTKLYNSSDTKVTTGNLWCRLCETSVLHVYIKMSSKSKKSKRSSKSSGSSDLSDLRVQMLQADHEQARVALEQKQFEAKCKFERLKLEYDIISERDGGSDGGSETGTVVDATEVGEMTDRWVENANQHLSTGDMNLRVPDEYVTIDEVNSTCHQQGAGPKGHVSFTPTLPQPARTSTPMDTHTRERDPSTPVHGSLDPKSAPFLPSRRNLMIDSQNTNESLLNASQLLQMTLASQQEYNKRTLLPAMKLEPFTGELTKFSTFRNAFVWNVESNTDDPRRRLTHLFNSLAGAPKDMIEGCLHLEPSVGYNMAWQMLNSRYLDNEELVDSFLETLFAWKEISPDDPDGLFKYSAFLFNVRCALGENYARMELKETMRSRVD